MARILDAAENRTCWSTFAGHAINEIMGSLLEKELKQELDWDDFEISIATTAEIGCIRTVGAI